MNHYIELTIIPNEEIPIYDIWPKLYTQLHLALVEVKNNQNQVSVGVSFPQYKAEKIEKKVMYCLGSKLRVFANSLQELETLELDKWLARLADYVHVTSIRPVPEKLSGHAIYQRQQVKTNPERLARRFARRHGVGLDQAMQRYQSMDAIRIATPFIRLHSLSSEHTFCLWIKKTVAPDAVTGGFSTYGLSAQTTVPEF